MHLLIFLLSLAGSWLIISAFRPGLYRPAILALRARAPKRLTQTQIAVNAIALRLLPLVDIEPIKRTRLAEILSSLGHKETPEEFQARALAKSLLLATALVWSLLLSPYLGLGLMGAACFAAHSGQEKKLQGEMAQRQQRIERELPQLASTIRQNLNSTRDVSSILAAYRKVCGPVLRGEIDRTLNDMVTGNQERALKALEARVASPKLGQLVRGLVAVQRGDDQRTYFDMLAMEYRKSQNEEVSKILLQRPDQLNPYLGLLFLGLVLMITAALGTYIVQQLSILFA